MVEPIDIRTGKPFTSRRQHLHHPPSDGASLGGNLGRARGLMGGAFMGCMMAQGRELINFVSNVASPEVGRGRCFYTGWVPSANGEIEIDCRFFKANSNYNFVGAGNTRMIINTMSNDGVELNYKGSWDTSYTPSLLDRHTIKMNCSGLYFDGELIVPFSSFLVPYKQMVIFDRWRSDTASGQTGSSPAVAIYRFVGRENGEVVLDYRPALDPNGVLCFYDVVSKSYIYNQLSGSLCTMVYSDAGLEKIENCGSITSIGQDAFKGCAALTSVGDLTACTSIGQDAFYGCSSLTSVGDLTACTSIGNGAFAKCVNLTTITATRATSLGYNAFDGCNNLREAHFSASYLRTIGSRCFSWYQGTGACYSLETVTGLDNVAQLGELTFTCESLQSIYMPSCTKFTGVNNFQGCKRIRSITLGAMTSMGANNFIDCGILNSADADGIKCTIAVANTMQSWRDINGLQQGAPKTTKFVCADGYIAYENGAWTDHPNA